MRAALPLLALVLAACASHPPLPPASEGTIRLQESCGYIMSCPTYSMTLHPDGSFHYEGTREVRVRGPRDGTLDRRAWERAEAAFTRANWDTLEAPTRRTYAGVTYPCIPDSPHAVVTRRVGAGEEKTVDFNLGCSSYEMEHLVADLRAAMPLPGA